MPPNPYHRSTFLSILYQDLHQLLCNSYLSLPKPTSHIPYLSILHEHSPRQRQHYMRASSSELVYCANLYFLPQLASLRSSLLVNYVDFLRYLPSIVEASACGGKGGGGGGCLHYPFGWPPSLFHWPSSQTFPPGLRNPLFSVEEASTSLGSQQPPRSTHTSMGHR